MIKAIFFDFDGVLTPHPSGRHTTCMNLQASTGIAFDTLKAAFDNKRAELQLGTISSEDFWFDLCATLGKNFDITLLYEAYANTPLDPEMFRVVKALKENYKIGIITNNAAKRIEILQDKYQLTEIFDSITCSAHLGVKKPEPAIFKAAVDSLEVTPEESAYLDNSEKDVAGGDAFGIHSYHFDDAKRDYKSLEAWLRGLGVEF